MKKMLVCVAILLIITIACDDRNEFNFRVELPEFDFPETVMFKDSLSEYDIFQGIPADLIPAQGVELLELSSILFTDYAYKQRLVKLPDGAKMTKQNDNTLDFPDGTILTKTFFYYHDERDTTLGKRIIETRLLVKSQNKWNVATYIWNDQQNNATIKRYGEDTQVN
ncbi:MAG: hypothetical protein AAGI23_02065 [Bacteroidota bacterium]